MKKDKSFTLRPLVSEDAESMAKQLNNKKVWDNLRDGLPHPYTIEDAKSFIELQHNEPSLTCYGIVVDGRLVGNIGFTRNHDVIRLYATPYGHNKASARVLKKAGFLFKCVMTKAAYKNGQFTDELYFERIK